MASKRSFGVLPLAVVVACGGGTPPATPATTTSTDSARTAAAPDTSSHGRRAPFDTLAAAGQRPLMRETYHYQGSVRDPFRAEVTIAQAGPELPDLKLIGIIYNADQPEKSIATFRETGSDRRYVWHPGDRFARITVVSMTRTDVTLSEDDFGVLRRQRYSLRKPEDANP
jgi:hypothetical protein